MSNLELAREKLEAARLVLGAAGNYLETVNRLLAESRKLGDEAERLIEGEYASIKQGQPGTPQPSDALDALPGCVPGDAD